MYFGGNLGYTGFLGRYDRNERNFPEINPWWEAAKPFF
jgi:hypothetical protein